MVDCNDRGNSSTAVFIPVTSNNDFSLLSVPASSSSSSSSSFLLSIFVSTATVLHTPSSSFVPVSCDSVVVVGGGTTIGIPLLRKCAMR